MGKHARKRQKTAKAADEVVQPLGTRRDETAEDDAGKDDEERRLESMLFGKPYVPSGKGKENVLVIESDEEEAGGAKELDNLLDTDLFYIDDGAPSKDVPELDPAVPEQSDEDDGDDVDGSRDNLEIENESGEENAAATDAPAVELNNNRSGKAPVWTDPDDTTLQISLASDKRLRKLRDGAAEDTVGGREYESRLRRQFERINPTPEWATKARKTLHPSKQKRRRTSVSSESEAGDEEESRMQELLTSTNGILGTTKSKLLEKGTLSIERLRDANQAAVAEGAIKAMHFHPSPDVPILLAASADRRLRLFNIDGLTNPHLQTLHVPSLPLTNALFHPSGSSILLTGPRPFYFTYDLQSGTTTRSPRGLWGTTFSNRNPSAQDAGMEIAAFNPTGEVLAVAGRRGYVHLVDWKSGAGQVVGSVKMNTTVKDLWWGRGGSAEGRELMSLGEDAEVYVWDVRERRCIKRWKDDGGFGSRVMTGDSAGKYLAIGSNNGLVNVYGPDGATSDGVNRPKALKTIGNLTTSISTLRFNHDSQLLAIASHTKKDQMRLIHLPSLTAFANWPTSSTPLSHVSAIGFSTRSEYVAVGNSRGRVLLYHLRDFARQ